MTDIAGQIRAAVLAERERCAEMVVRLSGDKSLISILLADAIREDPVPATPKGDQC